MQESGAAALHVLIVGAGTIGLLVAQALKKAGIDASVFEAEPTASYYRAREWGTSIQWALPMLPRLLPEELLARLQSTAVDVDTESPEHGDSMPAYNGQTGEILKQVALPRFVRVSRHKFRALCAEGINVQYNKRLASASTTPTGVALTFEDGTIATGTLLIGADGANSKTRNLIFGPESGAATPLPYKAINTHVHYNNAAVSTRLRSALTGNNVVALAFHPRGWWLWLSVQELPDALRPETWVFQLQWTWAHSNHASVSSNPITARVQLAELKRAAHDALAEPWRSVWTEIPDATPVFENSISTWTPVALPRGSQWRGKSALVGDAAHAMSFHRGQGLNHGIADAVGLVGELVQVRGGEKGLDEALGDYEADVVQRAGEEVRMGTVNTEMVHDWDTLMESPFMKMGGARSS